MSFLTAGPVDVKTTEKSLQKQIIVQSREVETETTRDHFFIVDLSPEAEERLVRKIVEALKNDKA